MSDVRRLGLSLDRITSNPGCSLDEARALSETRRALAYLCGISARVSRFFRALPSRRASSSTAPPLEVQLAERTECLPETAPPVSVPSSPNRVNFLRIFRKLLAGKLTTGESSRHALQRALTAYLPLRPLGSPSDREARVRPHRPTSRLRRPAN